MIDQQRYLYYIGRGYIFFITWTINNWRPPRVVYWMCLYLKDAYIYFLGGEGGAPESAPAVKLLFCNKISVFLLSLTLFLIVQNVVCNIKELRTMFCTSSWFALLPVRFKKWNYFLVLFVQLTHMLHFSKITLIKGRYFHRIQ